MRKQRYRDEAVEARERGMAHGSGDAANALANHYYFPLTEDGFPEGDEEFDEELEQVIGLYRRADELGHPFGAEQLGYLLVRRGDRAGAIAAYQRAEARGNPRASGELARLLRDPAQRAAAAQRDEEIGYTQAWDAEISSWQYRA